MSLILLDTNIVIRLRDSGGDIAERLTRADIQPALSVITRVELENGVYREPRFRDVRRARLDVILDALMTLEFGVAEAEQYRDIVARLGFNRVRILDRMIAATALAHGFPLATLNPRDFEEIAELELEDWSGED